MKVRDLLNEKSRPVYTIGGQRSLEDAVRRMADKNASALIVTDNDRPIGIFAERDVFRHYLRNKSTALFETALRNAMTDRLITVGPEDEVSRVIAIMVQADITHLPVMAENKIIGMLTLNDLIERQLESLNAEIHQLKDYIEDLHEAGRDW
jgi:IMP dehydrogenase